MPLSQRVALSLFAFGLAGLVLMALQPTPSATALSPDSYALAISTGTGFRLEQAQNSASAQNERLSSIAAQTPALACASIVQLGMFKVGTRCVSNGWQVSLND